MPSSSTPGRYLSCVEERITNPLVVSWSLTRPINTALPIAGNYRQSASSGRSRKDGVSQSAVIFALGSEESKGENDVSQLPD